MNTDTPPQPTCALCKCIHDFDTSVPSFIWNKVIREVGLPEYLCLSCIVKAFGQAKEPFTAILYGDVINFASITFTPSVEVIINSPALSTVEVHPKETMDEVRTLSFRAGWEQGVAYAKYLQDENLEQSLQQHLDQ